MILAVRGRGLETCLVGLGIRRNGLDGEMWLGPGSAHGRVTPTGRGVYRQLRERDRVRSARTGRLCGAAVSWIGGRRIAGGSMHFSPWLNDEVVSSQLAQEFRLKESQGLTENGFTKC